MPLALLLEQLRRFVDPRAEQRRREAEAREKRQQAHRELMEDEAA